MRPPTAARPAHKGARIAALVLMLGLVCAALTGYLAGTRAEAQYTAVGSVTLTQVAGNRPAYELNTFAADFETALAGPEVRRAIREALPAGAPPTPVLATRLPDASRITLSLTAQDAESAGQALVAAGRTAYRQVVEQQSELSRVRAEAARVRLDSLTEQVEQLRQATEGADDDERAERQALLDQQRQAVGIAVGELSAAEGGLAVAETIAANLDRSQAVTLGDTAKTSTLPAVLSAAAAGLLGGALTGLVLSFGLYRVARRRRRPPSESDGASAPGDVREDRAGVDGLRSEPVAAGAYNGTDSRVRVQLRPGGLRRPLMR